MRTHALRLTAIADFPDIRAGDDLGRSICAAVRGCRLDLHDGDVLVVAQKVVSKAENRYVDLKTVVPTSRALELAATTGKDARLVEVILRESVRIVRAVPDVLIVEHRLGHVMANAGVDQSNVARAGDELALCLPADPDASAERLREALHREFGCLTGVIINDSFGRPWRRGTVGVAIGAAGLPSIVDLRGSSDRYGRTLRATVVGFADEIAAAASLLMGQADEGQPVVHVRGLAWTRPSLPARELVRPAREDLFR